MSCSSKQSFDSPEQVAPNRIPIIPRSYRPAPRAASIPTFRIDLSLPPSDRYAELATAFAPHLCSIGKILDDVLKSRVRFVALRGIIKYLTRHALRHVHLPEEMEELQGIANVSGADLHLLVAFNVLLDSSMGCTSGGVLTTTTEGKAEMMHFRTLDWDMDGLRGLLVVLEYVRSNSNEPEKVVARSVTYAGFVGVLTGVRESLSISLNNRPPQDFSSFHVRAHQLLVLLGRRPSISSLLRSIILPDPVHPTRDIQQVIMKLSHQTSTPCYIILSDGRQTACVEKDLHFAKSRSSTEFIIQTNHDTSCPLPDDASVFLHNSELRHSCVRNKWLALKRSFELTRRQEETSKGPNDGKGEAAAAADTTRFAVPEPAVKSWLLAFPTMNGETHYACLLDPTTGDIRMLERGVWVKAEDDDIEAEGMRAEQESMILDTGNDSESEPGEEHARKSEEGRVVDPLEMLREQDIMILDMDHVLPPVPRTSVTDTDQVTLREPENLKKDVAVVLEDDQATLTDKGAA